MIGARTLVRPVVPLATLVTTLLALGASAGAFAQGPPRSPEARRVASPSMYSSVAPRIPAAAPAASDADGNPHVWKPQTKIGGGVQERAGLLHAGRRSDAPRRLVRGRSRCRRPRSAPWPSTPAVRRRWSTWSARARGRSSSSTAATPPRTLAAKRGRLEACKNLKVQLVVQAQGAGPHAAGKLVSVGPEFVVLEATSNSFAVPLEGITKMQVLELPLRIHLASDAEKKAARRPRLGMAYLRKGITWIPEYTLKVARRRQRRADPPRHAGQRGRGPDPHRRTPRRGRAALRPHRVHGADGRGPGDPHDRRRWSPAEAFRRKCTTQIMNRAAIVSNANTAPLVGGPRRGGAAGGGRRRRRRRRTGQSAADGAARQPPTTPSTPRKTSRSAAARRRSSRSSPRRSSTRTSTAGRRRTRWSTPWCCTTRPTRPGPPAPAWPSAPSSPLSEDLLQYTPKGGKGELPVTAAINMAHEKTEREIDRKLKAHSPAHERLLRPGHPGRQAQAAATTRSGRVEIVITNPIPGKPISADAGGVISVDPDEAAAPGARKARSAGRSSSSPARRRRSHTSMSGTCRRIEVGSSVGYGSQAVERKAHGMQPVGTDEALLWYV